MEHNRFVLSDMTESIQQSAIYKGVFMNEKVKQLSGANMDIDLTSNPSDIHWEQTMCPWNKEEKSTEHKCAVKNTSICKYFCGIQYLDSVLCSYPYENTDVLKDDKADI